MPPMGEPAVRVRVEVLEGDAIVRHQADVDAETWRDFCLGPLGDRPQEAIARRFAATPAILATIERATCPRIAVVAVPRRA